jgi:hypothetical protein
MSIDYTLCPYRFTPDPPAMVAFLEALGLQPVTRAESGDFAVLAGRSGRVAVHGAHVQSDGSRTVETSLNFEALDASQAADALRAQGLETTVWDEAFGKLAGALSPLGYAVWVNEVMHDLYGGYRTAEPDGASSIGVVAVHGSPDLDADTAFFARFGYHPADGDSTYRSLRAPGGVIWMNALTGKPARTKPGDFFGPTALVELAFETTEPLPGLVERLLAAGYADAELVEQKGRHVTVTDPDGEYVEIYPVPGAASE